MTTTTPTLLSRADATLLSAAAVSPDGSLASPATYTPLAMKRLIGRLLKRGLIELSGEASPAAHRLTPAGYAAVGMNPPPPAISCRTDLAATESPGKRERVLGLLMRGDGATLPELIAATGWLPHTTRAALSRLRTAGRVLDKSRRPDGSTAYRIAGSASVDAAPASAA